MYTRKNHVNQALVFRSLEIKNSMHENMLETLLEITIDHDVDDKQLDALKTNSEMWNTSQEGN